MKDSEVLECAIEKLEEEGWIQGGYYCPGQGYCSVGAVTVCATTKCWYPYTDTGRAILKRNGFPNAEMIETPTIWQDSSDRTQEEVMAALQKAVEVARAREAEEEWEAHAVRDRNLGLAGVNLAGEPDAEPGELLTYFDPNGMGGGGVAIWTYDTSKAIHFDTPYAAMRYWKQRSTVLPLRPDGLPNRPLTAYTVEIIKVD
jgi:hypothetical protein